MLRGSIFSPYKSYGAFVSYFGKFQDVAPGVSRSIKIIKTTIDNHLISQTVTAHCTSGKHREEWQKHCI